ncbi:MAG: DUF3368 domain-containing protein [Nitrospira sp.]|nr:DUF3368 domain-containing protein [Nitrospira sp.]
MKVVCDTNIIIDFSKIGQLNLIKEVFDEVLIPHEVKEELMAGEADGVEDADLKKVLTEWISIKTIKDRFAYENLKIHIDKGEAASIILYKETNADLLAINDLKARGIARALEVRIIGTLGILLLAKDRGLINEIKPIMEKLRTIGAYISSSLYNRILKDAGEL